MRAISLGLADASFLPNCVCRKSFYDILQVSKASTDEQIKRAYRKLAVKYHPVRAARDVKRAACTHV